MSDSGGSFFGVIVLIIVIILFGLIAYALYSYYGRVYIQNLATGNFLVLKTSGSTTYVSANGSQSDPTSQWRVTFVEAGTNQMTLTNVSTGYSLDYQSAMVNNIITCDSGGGGAKSFTQNVFPAGSTTVFYRSVQNTTLFIAADEVSANFPNLDHVLYLRVLEADGNPGTRGSFQYISVL